MPATPPGELIDAVVRAAVRERADVIVVGLPKPPRDFEAERAEARRRERCTRPSSMSATSRTSVSTRRTSRRASARTR